MNILYHVTIVSHSMSFNNPWNWDNCLGLGDFQFKNKMPPVHIIPNCMQTVLWILTEIQGKALPGLPVSQAKVSIWQSQDDIVNKVLKLTHKNKMDGCLINFSKRHSDFLLEFTLICQNFNRCVGIKNADLECKCKGGIREAYLRHNY